MFGDHSVLVGVCVCARERERERKWQGREREGGRERATCMHIGGSEWGRERGEEEK